MKDQPRETIADLEAERETIADLEAERETIAELEAFVWAEGTFTFDQAGETFTFDRAECPPDQLRPRAATRELDPNEP